MTKQLIKKSKAVVIAIALEIFILTIIPLLSYLIDSSTDKYRTFIYPLLNNCMFFVVGISIVFKYIKFKACTLSWVAACLYVLMTVANIIFLFIPSVETYHDSIYPLALSLTCLIAIISVFIIKK